MKMIRNMFFSVCIMTFSLGVKGQNLKEFQEEIYPVYLLDTTILAKRNLEQKIEILGNNCNWSKRIGKKVDVFWLQTKQGDFFGHSFEYFLDCDNLRLIYWSNNPQNIFPIVDFMIEDLEEDSKFITSKKKYLKNKRKYKRYLNAELPAVGASE